MQTVNPLPTRRTPVRGVLLLGLLLCLVVPCAHAQMALGIKAGGNFNAFEVEGYSTASSDVTYHMGVMGYVYVAQLPIGRFAVQPEVLYSRKVASIAYGDGIEGTNKLVMHYLEVPLGVIYAYKLGNVMPYISAAPYLAYLIRGQSSLRGGAEGVKDPIVAGLRNMDYGLKLGGGLVIAGFQLSAMYSRGYANLATEGPTTRSTLIELSLGYFFM